MDHVARYHQIGRRFADLSDAQLNRIWVEAFRACYDRRRTDQSSTWRDAEAELMLRRLPAAQAPGPGHDDEAH